MSSDIGGKLVSNMAWRFGEKITAQGVSFVVSIFLARILMPEDYGIVAIVNIFIAIAGIFVTSGLGTALIQKKEASSLDFSTLFWCNLVLSGIIYAIVFLGAPFISSFYNIPLLTQVLRVLAIQIPINAFNSIQNAYVSRHMEFKKFFFATLIGTIVSAVVGIYMAYHDFGVWALVAQVLANNVIDTIVLFLIIDWKPRIEFSAECAKPLVKYGWKILATDLIGTIFNHLNSFVIGKKYMASDLAYYTQGMKIPNLINNNLDATLSAVLFPVMSLSSGIEEIKNIRRKSLKIMEYILFPLMFGLIVTADKIILVLFTQKWVEAVPYVRISAFTAIIGVLGTTLIQETKAIGKSDMTLRMEIVKKPLMLICLLAAIQFGVRAIAYTLIINTFIAFIFNVYPVRKYIGFDFKMHLKDAFSSFWMAVVMCVVVYGIGRIFEENLLALIVQVIVGGTVYLGLSIVSRNESYEYLRKYVLLKIRS